MKLGRLRHRNRNERKNARARLKPARRLAALIFATILIALPVTTTFLLMTEAWAGRGGGGNSGGSAPGNSGNGGNNGNGGGISSPGPRSGAT